MYSYILGVFAVDTDEYSYGSIQPWLRKLRTRHVQLTKWQPSSSPRFARMDICLSRCQRLASPETREHECGEEGPNSISVR